MSMDYDFDIGGCRVRATAPDGLLHPQGGILQNFMMEPGQPDHTVEFDLADDLEIPEAVCLFDNAERRVYGVDGGFVSLIGGEKPYLRLERRGNRTLATGRREVYPDGMAGKTMLTAMEVEHLVVRSGGFLLHASCIEYRGRAIVFTAPSGTGKSTQAELWRRERGAEVLNGDRIVIRREGTGFVARDIPFSGTSGICRRGKLPLGAIVCLSQALSTTIAPLTGRWAFHKIWEGCSVHVWNSADVARCAETVSDCLTQIPVYHLACTPDLSAVEALEAVL